MNNKSSKSSLRKYARSTNKNLKSSDFLSWVFVLHRDGSEFYLKNCHFEFIRELKDNVDINGIDKKSVSEDDLGAGWLIIYTKVHGIKIYSETDMVEWEAGDSEADDKQDIVALYS
jgi:hypothetical protein